MGTILSAIKFFQAFLMVRKLIERLKTTKKTKGSMLLAAKSVISTAREVNSIMQDCTKIAKTEEATLDLAERMVNKAIVTKLTTTATPEDMISAGLMKNILGKN